jgi:uncharacterized MAPEG superfamily protein
MSTDLFYLVALSLLSASMWMPYIIGANLNPPADRDAGFIRPPDLNQFPAWVHRAHRAQANLAENFGPFAALVLIAQLTSVSTALFSYAVATFFWLRVAHAAGMISGLTRFPARPIIFTLAWVCILVMAWQLFSHIK